MLTKPKIALVLILGLSIFSQSAFSKDEISGRWKGMFHCFGVNYFFNMDVEKGDGNAISATLKADPKLMGRKGINWKPEPIQTRLHGEFIPELGIFKLKSSQVKNTQWFDFVGVIEPETENMSALVESRNYNNCSYLLGSKKNITKLINPIVKNAKYTPARSNSNGIARQQCDADIQSWLKQLDDFSVRFGREHSKYASLILFQDQYFKPIFGSSFESTSKSRLAKINYQIQVGCPLVLRSQQARWVLPQIVVVLENNAGLSRAEVFMYPVAKKVVRDWSHWAKENLQLQSGLTVNQLDLFVESANKVSQILWPADEVDFRKEIELVKQHRKTDQFLTDIRERIETGVDSIEVISELITFSSSQARQGVSSEGGRQADQIISNAVNDNVLSATKTFISDKDSLQSLRSLRQIESNAVFSLFIRYMNVDNKQQINSLLKEQSDKVTYAFAKEESDKFIGRNYNQNETLSVLEDLIAYEKSLDQKYGTLLNENVFSEFNEIRNDLRGKLFNKHRESIVSLIQSSNNFDQTDSVIDKYTVSKDSFRVSMLRKVQNLRLSEIRTQINEHCNSLALLARSTMGLRFSGAPKKLALSLAQGIDNDSIRIIDFVYGYPFGDTEEEAKEFMESSDKKSYEDLAASQVQVGCLKAKFERLEQ